MKKRIKKCGIYALTFGGQVIYVGQSKDIENRVKDHFRWKTRVKEIQKKGQKQGGYTRGQIVQLSRYQFIGMHEGKVSYKILEECSESQLDAYEEYWIKRYNPIFNYEGVYVEYRGQRKKRSYSYYEKCAW